MGVGWPYLRVGGACGRCRAFKGGGACGVDGHLRVGEQWGDGWGACGGWVIMWGGGACWGGWICGWVKHVGWVEL